MTSHTRSLCSMAMMLSFGAAPVIAEPITAVYHVQVTQRMINNFTPLPFDQAFTLLLTFDPALATGQGYGPATFSPVPLERIDPPAGVALETFRSTSHGRFEENPFGGRRNLFAAASESLHDVGPEWDYFSIVRLISNVPAGEPPPAFTAETFPHHLVLGSPTNFSYSSSLWETGPTTRLVGSLHYGGLARLVSVSQAAPVPEPATVALVGAGLVLLGRRQRRRKPQQP